MITVQREFIVGVKSDFCVCKCQERRENPSAQTCTFLLRLPSANICRSLLFLTRHRAPSKTHRDVLLWADSVWTSLDSHWDPRVNGPIRLKCKLSSSSSSSSSDQSAIIGTLVLLIPRVTCEYTVVHVGADRTDAIKQLRLFPGAESSICLISFMMRLFRVSTPCPTQSALKQWRRKSMGF